jgi:hypothetical protein
MSRMAKGDQPCSIHLTSVLFVISHIIFGGYSIYNGDAAAVAIDIRILLDQKD